MWKCNCNKLNKDTRQACVSCGELRYKEVVKEVVKEVIPKEVKKKTLKPKK